MRGRVYRWRVPWRSPALGAGRPREGLFLRTAEGAGECAPLPGLHPHSVDELAGLLLAWVRGDDRPLPPPASFAVAAARLQPVDIVVESAALLPVGHPLADLPADLHALKVKLGSDLARNQSVLAAVRARFPDAELRVDFNRGLGFEDALAHAGLLADQGVGVVEEPLRDRRELPDAAIHLPPLALDESLRDDPELVHAPWMAVGIVKPEAGGAIEPVVSAGKRALVSACYPTDLGLWALGRLAAELPGAQGLGTRRFLDQAGMFERALEGTDVAFSLHVRPEPRWSALEELT